MLHGQFNEIRTYGAFLTHPIWNTALTWIRFQGETLPDGEYEIQGRDMYAIVESVKTLAYADSLYEMHNEYIDIHFCLSGGESIAYEPIGDLVEKELNKEKDYQLFLPNEKYSICNLQTNSFAIFFPKELHMPKLQDGMNQEVRKVVIKVKASILAL